MSSPINGSGSNPDLAAITSSSAFQSLPANVQTQLLDSLTVSQLQAFLNSNLNLEAPQQVNSLTYLSGILETTREFRQQLEAGKQANRETMQKTSDAATSQALLLASYYSAQTTLIAKNNKQLNQDEEALYNPPTLADEYHHRPPKPGILEKIETEAAKLKNDGTAITNDISTLQTDLTTLKNRYQALLDAQTNDFTKNADGSYTVNSQAAADDYNAKMTAYQTALTTLTADYQTLTTHISTYNTEATQLQPLITALKDLLGPNHLPTPYNLSLPSDVAALLSKLQSTPLTLGNLPNFAVTPTSVTYPSPTPPYQFSFPNPTPATFTFTIPSSNSLFLSTVDASEDFESLYTAMQEKLEETLAPNKKEIAAALNMLRFYQSVANFTTISGQALTNLISNENLTQQLLPAAIITRKRPTFVQTMATPLHSQVLSSAPHVQGILGKGIFKDILKKVDDQIIDSASLDQQTILSDRLSLFSENLLNETARQALLPSFGPLSNILATLPSNSPAFGILFSLSLLNRVQEIAESGITESSLKTLLANTPELASLANQPDVLSALNGAVQIGLLAVAVRLLSEKLGLSDLAPQLLAPLISETEPSNLPTSSNLPPVFEAQINAIAAQVQTDNLQESRELQNAVQNYFEEKGLAKSEAQFLSQLAADIVDRSVPLAPAATTISPQTVQVDLLTRSLAANLVLNGIGLDRAQSIASQAIEQTLQVGPFANTPLFTTQLETQLRHLGLKKIASEIAGQVTLVAVNSHSVATAKASQPFNVLSPSAIRRLLEDHLQGLLRPQVGKEITQEITQQVITSLYGATPSIASPIITSPFSVGRVLQNALLQLGRQSNETFHEGRVEVFKELHRSSTDLAVFLQKIMEPANLYVYSIYSGIMYAGNEPKNWRKSIDIPV
jgi:hypothetical protein